MPVGVRLFQNYTSACAAKGRASSRAAKYNLKGWNLHQLNFPYQISLRRVKVRLRALVPWNFSRNVTTQVIRRLRFSARTRGEVDKCVTVYSYSSKYLRRTWMQNPLLLPHCRVQRIIQLLSMRSVLPFQRSSHLQNTLLWKRKTNQRASNPFSPG